MLCLSLALCVMACLTVGCAQTGVSVGPGPSALSQSGSPVVSGVSVVTQAVEKSRAPVVPVASAEQSVGPRTGAADVDRYASLAKSLAKEEAEVPLPVAVGNFLYEETELLSPFSALLRKELEHALGASGKFRVITRSRLADFQLEGKFQDSGMLEPGTKVKSIAIEGVKGIVRGTFHYQHPKLTVFAELAMLDGGEVRTARMEMPVDEAGARFWPDKSQDEAQAARVLKPQNIKQSQENLADVTNRLKRVPCEFGLQVVVADGRRDFAEGETMVYRVLAEQDCYVAMLCHQSDGSTVMLFPNAWCTGTAVAAGKVVEIPGTRKAGFEFVAGPPYGADVVQVIACTQRSSLHAMLEKQVAAAPEGTPYCGLARGIVVKGVEKAMDEAPGAGSGAAVRWSEAHVVVCTYPK